MDLHNLDDCDAEVWRLFPENFTEPKEFTKEPQSVCLKPVPVHLEPPYPWDCGTGYTRSGHATSMKTSAFTPVVKTPVNEDENVKIMSTVDPTSAKVHGVRREVPKVSRKVMAKDTRQSLPTYVNSDENRVNTEILRDALREKLDSAQSQLETVRMDIQNSKLYVQSLEQKNKKLQSRIGKYRTENLHLKHKYETLYDEKIKLQNEIAALRLGQEDRHTGERDCGFDGKLTEAKEDENKMSGFEKKGCEVKGDHANHTVSVCSTNSITVASAKAVSTDIVGHRKKNKKRSVLKQLRKAFRKLTF